MTGHYDVTYLSSVKKFSEESTTCKYNKGKKLRTYYDYSCKYRNTSAYKSKDIPHT